LQLKFGIEHFLSLLSFIVLHMGHHLKRFGRLFCSYLALFFLLSYPSSRSFLSMFLCDQGDGFQNVWNIWWVKYSLFHLHTNPLYTRFLFFPAGASLLGHTISLTNTIPAAMLALFLKAQVAHNIWLILGFALGGTFTSYLFLEIGSGMTAAFTAGFIYTFSEFHFAHAIGHYQLIALQWLPLFLWAWLRFISEPGLSRALAASSTFLLVFFTDYYYATYAIIAGLLAFTFRVGSDRELLRNKKLWTGLCLFAVIVLIAAGPIAVATMNFLRTPLSGIHSPYEFEVDLLAPFIPGKLWRFSALTEPLWSVFKTPPVEGSAYLGYSTLILAAIGLVSRRKCFGWKEWFLVSIGALFLLLSFGPTMRVGGVAIRGLWGPYHHFESLVPILKSSGVPSRMIVMTILASALLAGLGVEALQSRSRRATLAVLLLTGFVEFLPSGLPNTPTAVPAIFEQMKDLPRGYGVLDRSSRLSTPLRMYYQTHFELPTSGGYISREPMAVTEAEARIQLSADRGEWKGLCENLGLRYVLLSVTDPVPQGLVSGTPVLEGDGFRLFDLGQWWSCRG
jgi:hypothetical protein